jgi:hypothetical protein
MVSPKNMILVGGVIAFLVFFVVFMIIFNSTASHSSAKQNFESSCLQWAMKNCGGEPSQKICSDYQNFIKDPKFNCSANKETIAKSCGCSEPYGIERP